MVELGKIFVWSILKVFRQEILVAWNKWFALPYNKQILWLIQLNFVWINQIFFLVNNVTIKWCSDVASNEWHCLINGSKSIEL